MTNTIFIKEFNSNTNELVYLKGPENTIVSLNASLNPKRSLIIKTFKDIFLPQGYPDSVSEDYKAYQLWDTLQAFCSTITNTLATRAVLQGVGVGDEAASAISAAITWIMKDGIGMVARIVFAWISGSRLDGECKKWRFFADILNDLAICIELFFLPLFKNQALEILCISTSLKGIVGVAGGATRAAITQHQAIKNNMGDVSAKDGSQETLVNLIASVIGIAVLTIIGNSSNVVWFVFFTLTALHLMANYKAVKVLNIKKFNEERLNYVIQKYLTSGCFASPSECNGAESIVVGFGMNSKTVCGYNIKIGRSIEHVTKLDLIYPFELQFLTHLYKGRKYMIIVCSNSKVIYILLDKNHSSLDIIEAYFHAVLQGITGSYVFNNEMVFCENVNLEKTSNLLHKVTKGLGLDLNDMKDRTRLDAEIIGRVDEIAAKEVNHFLNNLSSIGWELEENVMYVGDWRASWKGALTSYTDY